MLVSHVLYRIWSRNLYSTFNFCFACFLTEYCCMEAAICQLVSWVLITMTFTLTRTYTLGAQFAHFQISHFMDHKTTGWALWKS